MLVDESHLKIPVLAVEPEPSQPEAVDTHVRRPQADAFGLKSEELAVT